MTMRSLNGRGGSPDRPCKEYEKLQRVAEDILANVGDSTSLEEFEQVQKGLLFLYQELRERRDPLHFRTPGGHRCLDDAYLEYAMKLRTRFILQKEPAAAPPAPMQPPLTPDAVVNNLRTLAEELKRPRDTYLGADEPPPPRSTG
jgi:hypothetical protein